MTMSSTAGKRDHGIWQSRDVAGWLSLATSPTFALKAWISADDVQTMICSSSGGVLPIGGMALMYLLMSFFHLPPWLRLFSRHQHSAVHPQP